MKAIYFNEHGGIEKLSYGELPDPSPATAEILIQVKACALNHFDVWVLKGWKGLNLQMPHVGGGDISGIIADIGKGVTGYSVGDKVVINPGFTTGDDEWTRRGEECLSPHYRIIGEHLRGGFAEYLTVPAETVFPLPAQTEFRDASAQLLVALTSWRMLKHRALLQKGESVLIVGAGGGVNSMAIQVSRYLGAEVIALSSTDEKCEKARQLGASEVINYRDKPDWHRKVLELTAGRGVDVVVDNVGQQTMMKSIKSATRGGRIVTVGNTSGAEVTFDNRYVFIKQLSLIGSTMGTRADFEKVLKLIAEKKIKPIIDKTFPLAEGIDAYRYLSEGQQFGKVVVET